MLQHLSIDDGALRLMPLPLARLYRRAHNSKSTLQRHQAGFYLWEASLRMLASVAVAEYARLEHSDQAVESLLRNLARPALGHWWEFCRTLVPILADREDAGFVAVQEALFGGVRADLPCCAALNALLTEQLENRKSTAPSVRMSVLFERMVRLRNLAIGHGALGLKSEEYYSRVGTAILKAMPEVLRTVDVLAGRRLLYLTEVAQTAQGTWTLDALELVGESPRRLPPRVLTDVDATRNLRPQRLYSTPSSAEGPSTVGQVTGAVLVSMHPLLVFDTESDRVFFMSGKKGGGQATYLCYVSGCELRQPAFESDRRTLFEQVFGREVSQQEIEDWSRCGSAEEAVSVAPDDMPRTLGEFELVSILGRGGMGVVYRAWQPSLGRQVALKSLLRFGDRRADARFAREIQSLGRVEHPNLVKIFTSGTEAERWYYAMEIVQGTDLSSVLTHLSEAGAGDVGDESWHHAVAAACADSRRREQPIGGAQPNVPGGSVGNAEEDADHADAATLDHALGASGLGHVEAVVRIASQVASAAHALHEAGIYHRDIKPANIILSEDGLYAVLTDLGLAQLADSVEGRLTYTRQFVGTVRYASPEQLLAVRKVDPRSDVYSIGATLWELLTGRLLFDATEEVAAPELMERVLNNDPEPPRRFNARIPGDLQAIVLKCLEKSPDRRYQTARELEEDLARFLRGDPVEAKPHTLAYVVARYVGRHRRGLLASGLAFLAAILLVSGYYFGFVRISESYFARWSFRNRLVSGQAPLTTEEAGRRELSFRFETKGWWGPVVRVVAVNGSGRKREKIGSLIGDMEGQQAVGNAASVDFTYGTNGAVQREVARKRDGQVVWELVYHRLGSTRAIFVDSNGFVKPLGGSTVTHVSFERDARGFDQEVHYSDHRGRPQPHSDGSYGKRYVHDDNGLALRVTNLGRDDTPAPSKFGVVSEAYELDGNGAPVRIRFLDADDRPTVHSKHGFAESASTYDEVGNCVMVRYFGPDGQPTTDKQGVAGYTMRYDNRGNWIETSWRGTNDQATYHADGTAGWRATHDERGNVVEHTNLDAAGNPIASKDGYATMRYGFDTSDRLVSWTHLDEAGHRTVDADGVSRVRYVRDQRGRVVSARFYGIDDRPTVQADGTAGWQSTFDDDGRETRRTYLGLEGNAEPNLEGVAGWRASYDDREHMTEFVWLDREGKPVASNGNLAGWRSEYDAEGNMVEYSHLGEDEQLVESEGHVAGWRSAFDQRGNETSRRYFDTRRKDTQHKDGQAGWSAAYDVRGNRTEFFTVGLDGRKWAANNNVAGWSSQYDAHGRETRQVWLGTDGQPVADSDGCNGWKARYDARGNLTEKVYVDLAGNALSASGTVAGWRSTFDRKGNEIARTFIRASDTSSTEDGEHAGWIATYDRWGRIISRYDVDDNGVPVPSGGQPAGVTLAYDPHGRQIRQTIRNADGRPVAADNGVAGSGVTFDPKGRPLEFRTLGPDGLPVTGPAGYATLRRTYDSEGTLLRQRYFDAQGNGLQTAVEVKQVVAGSQAERNGVRPGDLVVSYNGVKGGVVELRAERDRVTAMSDADACIKMVVVSEGETKTIRLKPGMIGLHWDDVVVKGD